MPHGQVKDDADDRGEAGDAEEHPDDELPLPQLPARLHADSFAHDGEVGVVTVREVGYLLDEDLVRGVVLRHRHVGGGHVRQRGAPFVLCFGAFGGEAVLRLGAYLGQSFCLVDGELRALQGSLGGRRLRLEAVVDVVLGELEHLAHVLVQGVSGPLAHVGLQGG